MTIFVDKRHFIWCLCALLIFFSFSVLRLRSAIWRYLLTSGWHPIRMQSQCMTVLACSLVGAGTNKQHVVTKNTAKLDRETEELKHLKIPFDLGKIIQEGRASKGLKQSELAAVSWTTSWSWSEFRASFVSYALFSWKFIVFFLFCLQSITNKQIENLRETTGDCRLRSWSRYPE